MCRVARALGNMTASLHLRVVCVTKETELRLDIRQVQHRVSYAITKLAGWLQLSEVLSSSGG